MDEREPYMATKPAEGCLLALALCCFFWAGLFLYLAYRWGWI